jgi:hypothetical protein
MDDHIGKHLATGLRTYAQRTTANILAGGRETSYFFVSFFFFFFFLPPNNE